MPLPLGDLAGDTKWVPRAVRACRIARNKAIEPEERARIARLVAIDDPTAACHDLLVELHRTGMWVEQEAFSHLLLVPDASHRDPV